MARTARHTVGARIGAVVCLLCLAEHACCFVSRPFAQATPRLYTRMAGRGGSSDVASDSAFAKFEAAVDDQMLNAKAIVDSEPVQQVAKLAGEERFESIKTAVLAIVSCVIPEAIVGWLDPDRLTPRWEFQLDVLAFQVVLFALVYRYAVREGDNNPDQKLGVIAAFVLPRALFMVELPPKECLPDALTCGPDLLNVPVFLQIAKQLVIGAATIGGAAYGLERGFQKGVIRRFGSAASPPQSQADEGFRFPW
mmetsp:Transcript_11025/g.25218  ORF Transcript_11025/g.25218 Transcript_11025/m.25218 type:complete len:252 (-) Transcript_11025:20-775(-)